MCLTINIIVELFFMIVDKYTMQDMNFTWRDDPALSFPSDFTGDGYRLPRYVVSFTIENDMQFIYYGEGKKWEVLVIL